MIAYLKWEILDLELNKVIVLTSSWVGYEVLINDITFSKIKNDNLDKIEFYIYHHRTENSQILFWFLDKNEKKLFEELIKINWVGWKVALNILSIGVLRLLDAINSWDNKTIESIKWIWKKWASKIILELKDSDLIKGYDLKNIDKDSKKDLDKVSNISQDIHNNVKNTLVAMWYNWLDIDNVLKKMLKDILKVNEIITFVIKNM